MKGLEHTVEFRIAETDGIEFRCTLYYIGFGASGFRFSLACRLTIRKGIRKYSDHLY